VNIEIKVGGTYRTRDGRKATVVGYDSSLLRPWLCALDATLNYSSWRADGTWSDTECRFDIVAPWTDEPAPFDPIAALRARAIAYAAALPALTPEPGVGQVWRANTGYIYVLVDDYGNRRPLVLDNMEMNSAHGHHCGTAPYHDSAYVAPDLRTFLASDEGKAWLANKQPEEK
jgi:hypothetical protein